MPKLTAALAVVGVLALAAGCGDDASSSSAATATAGGVTTAAPSATGLPAVTGAFGEKPTVPASSSAAPKSLVARVLSTGTGKAVAKGDTLVVNYLGAIWDSGKVFDNSYDRKAATSFPIGVGKVIAGWDEGLVGQKVGSRMLLVIPPDKGYGSGGQAQAGIKGTDTLVFVIDVVGSYGATDAADGAPVAADPALPSVTAAAGEKPAIAVPAGKAAPTSLVAKVLLQGSGAEVKAGQTLVAQYVGVIYDGGKQFDASWDRKAPATFPIGKGQVIKGWDEGLVGQKIGSRVLLVIPPDKGYGAGGQAQAGIKGTDTLVFVVDILGAF